eukprot:679217-Prorocentrum_minimum.AAC.11
MEHCGLGKATISKLDPFTKLPKMSYKDGYQKHYYALDSFEEGAALLTGFAETVQHPPHSSL